MERSLELKSGNKSAYSLEDVKDFLKKRFLFEGDTDSLQILLNVYNVQESIENIFPTYISLRHLKTDIRKFLKAKEGKELIAYNLSSLIHDDVQRFEFYLYLEGYSTGFSNQDAINQVEILCFKYLDIEEIYNRKKLFNYEFHNREVLELKSLIFKDIDEDHDFKRRLRDLLYKFNASLIKPKIVNINRNIDIQLTINYEKGERYVGTNSFLTRGEIRGLNKRILAFLYKDGLKIYKNAYWHGINDKAKQRYK